MSDIDQQFVEYIVKSLVGTPDAVSIARSVDDKGVLLELTVDPEDLGRVIGKRGATAQSIRTLLRALGTKNSERYNLKIVDVSDGATPRASATDSTDADDTIPATATDTVVDDVADEQSAPVESERLSRTRRELAELDDLDI